jgi:hypothetical protein
MALTALTPTQLTYTTPVTFPASPGVAGDNTNGNAAPNGGTSVLVMNNTAGTSGTVTVAYSVNVDGQSVTSRVFTVPANTIQLVKLGPTNLFGTTVSVTPSASTIKLGVYAL